MNEPNRSVAELSTGELVGRLGEQVSRLVRDEFALATDELKEKANKHATPPVPEQAIRSTRRDIEAIKESAHR